MNNIEKCKALTLAMNSLRYNPNLEPVEIQSYEAAIRNVIDGIERLIEHEKKLYYW